jgi:hypothetical protein
MNFIIDAIKDIQLFQEESLTRRISTIEKDLQGLNIHNLQNEYSSLRIHPKLLLSAIKVKKATRQVSVIIHVLGILAVLPKILDEGEEIEKLSLGAGNTGKPFDVETNLRVAEFKFISWQGSDTIRQNSVFKDLFLLAEFDTQKRKQLFITGISHPIRFLQGKRALSSILSHHNKLWNLFKQKYGKQFVCVCDYYDYVKNRVQIIDLNEIIPEFVEF